MGPNSKMIIAGPNYSSNWFMFKIMSELFWVDRSTVWFIVYMSSSWLEAAGINNDLLYLDDGQLPVINLQGQKLAVWHSESVIDKWESTDVRMCFFIDRKPSFISLPHPNANLGWDAKEWIQHHIQGIVSMHTCLSPIYPLGNIA